MEDILNQKLDVRKLLELKKEATDVLDELAAELAYWTTLRQMKIDRKVRFGYPLEEAKEFDSKIRSIEGKQNLYYIYLNYINARIDWANHLLSGDGLNA